MKLGIIRNFNFNHVNDVTDFHVFRSLEIPYFVEIDPIL